MEADSISVIAGNRTSQIHFDLARRLPGDIDGDEDVDLADLLQALQVLAGTPPAARICNDGDADGDGQITMQDVLFILRQL